MTEIDSKRPEMSQPRSKLEAETSHNLNLREKMYSWQNNFNELIKKNDELNENKYKILEEICNKAENDLVEAQGMLQSEKTMNEKLIGKKEQFQIFCNDILNKHRELLNENHELRMKCDMKTKRFKKLISSRAEIKQLSGKLAQNESQVKANDEKLRKIIAMLENKQQHTNLQFNVIN